MNRLLRILLCFMLCLASTSQIRAADATPSYDDTLAKARKLMDDNKLAEAYLSASAAITLDDKRWEAYALVGLVLNAQGASADAKAYVDKALDRAPADKKASLQNIEEKISQSSSNPAPAASGIELTGEARRKLDVLMLIAEDADKAKTADERQKLLREYLDKSTDFVLANADQMNVWLIRAAAAVELGEPKIGWEAGKKLKTLGVDNSNDAKARKVMAMLDRKGWLGETEPIVPAQSKEIPIADLKRIASSANTVGTGSDEPNIDSETLMKMLTTLLTTSGTFHDPYAGDGMTRRGHTEIKYTIKDVKIAMNGEISWTQPYWIAPNMGDPQNEEGGFESDPNMITKFSFRVRDLDSILIKDIWSDTNYNDSTNGSKRGRGLDWYKILVNLKGKSGWYKSETHGQIMSDEAADSVEFEVKDKESAEKIVALLKAFSNALNARESSSLANIQTTGAPEVSLRTKKAQQQIDNYQLLLDVMRRNNNQGAVSKFEKYQAEWKDFLNGNSIEPKQSLEKTENGGWSLSEGK